MLVTGTSDDQPMGSAGTKNIKVFNREGIEREKEERARSKKRHFTFVLLVLERK